MDETRKQAGVAMLISDEIDFEAKLVRRHMDPRNFYKTFHPNTGEFTFFSAASGTF